MVNAHFSQFVKGAPPKPEFKKRHDVAVEIGPRKNKTTKIKRRESPVKGEATPVFSIDFHARERNGKPVMSYMMSANAIQFGEILTLWILENHTRLNYHPIALLCGILSAAVESWHEASGEDWRALIPALAAGRAQAEAKVKKGGEQS